jgi:hypothetical protein
VPRQILQKAELGSGGLGQNAANGQGHAAAGELSLRARQERRRQPQGRLGKFVEAFTDPCAVRFNSMAIMAAIPAKGWLEISGV